MQRQMRVRRYASDDPAFIDTAFAIVLRARRAGADRSDEPATGPLLSRGAVETGQAAPSVDRLKTIAMWRAV